MEAKRVWLSFFYLLDQMRLSRKIYVLLLLSIVQTSCTNQNDVQKENFQRQLGNYILDDKTNLGDYYFDRELYRKLTITFNNDSTWNLNMQVPFLYDSIGTWTASSGHLEEWNWLYYKNNPKISTQFTEPWTNDSIFYLNSATPKVGQPNIKEIYFKKVK